MIPVAEMTIEEFYENFPEYVSIFNEYADDLVLCGELEEVLRCVEGED